MSIDSVVSTMSAHNKKVMSIRCGKFWDDYGCRISIYADFS